MCLLHRQRDRAVRTFWETGLIRLNIAIIHSIFNIASTILLLPFCKQMEKLANLLVKDVPEKKAKDETLQLLDERFMETPSIAAGQCRKVAEKMAQLSRDCVFRAMDMIGSYTEEADAYVSLLESKIDRYEDALGAYIVKLEREELNRDDSKMLNLILHSIGDLERISDHAKNISETAAEMDRKGAVFSQEAQNEVQVYMDAVREIVQMATDAFSRQDAALASNVEPLEEVIDTLNAEVKDRHITRLQKGTCTIELGFMLSDLSNNLERVADHCSNLAVCTIETQKDEFDMHKYLKTIEKI